MEDWEQERAPRKISLREKTSRLLDLPADGVAGVPKVELLGDRELYLENYKGILSYGKEELHVDGGAWVLRISGRDLEIKAILASVYQALQEKGYNPINQIVGYILSEDPTYITNHNNARALIRKVDRDELLQTLVKYYLTH